jgi:hypothetical protein
VAVPERDVSSLHGRLRPDPDVVARRVDDELVLVQLRRNHVHALNRTGARLWELIAEGCSPEEALERMLEEFEVTRAKLRAEMDGLLDLLLREELLSPVEG